MYPEHHRAGGVHDFPRAGAGAAEQKCGTARQGRVVAAIGDFRTINECKVFHGAQSVGRWNTDGMDDADLHGFFRRTFERAFCCEPGDLSSAVVLRWLFCGALSGLMMDEAIAIPGRLAPGWAVRSRRDRMGRDANEAHVAVLKRSLRILRPADGSNGLGESNRSIAVCVASSGVDAGTRMTPIMRMFTDFKFQLRSHIEPGNESSGGCSVAAVIGRRQWWHALSNIGMPSVSLCA